MDKILPGLLNNHGIIDIKACLNGKVQHKLCHALTFHDLGASDADLASLVPPQRRPRLRVDDFHLSVPHDGSAGAGLHLERVLGKCQAHRQHRPGFRHPIALSDLNKTKKIDA